MPFPADLCENSAEKRLKNPIHQHITHPVDVLKTRGVGVIGRQMGV